jgi:hypothetical protein
MTKINGIHIYQGNCPDENNGSYSRDKNCPACNALDKVEKYEMFLNGLIVTCENPVFRKSYTLIKMCEFLDSLRKDIKIILGNK